MKTDFQHKIYDLVNLLKLTDQWKGNNETIIFTNGCFDLIHLGHIDYLTKAASLADHLIVGLNSDASVRRLKGPHRPIQNEQSRMAIMAALGCVDAVVVFDQDTPEQLIQTLSPDILVKGGDWRPEQIAGSAFVWSQGGKVITIPFLQGHSTTLIEQKIKIGS